MVQSRRIEHLLESQLVLFRLFGEPIDAILSHALRRPRAVAIEQTNLQ
jgi:hypothetical protein